MRSNVWCSKLTNRKKDLRRVATSTLKAEKNEKEWLIAGEAAIKLLRQWASSSTWNYLNKLCLLEAEFYFYKGDEENALEKYDASIEAASSHRFIHEEGLANQKAAGFHLYYGRKKEALFHFTRAKQCYEQWGALALVRNIDKEIR